MDKDKIITELYNAFKKQGITEDELAQKTGIPQPTIHRIITGANKKLDFDKINKVKEALGIVAETGEKYGVVGLHQQVTQEENELLQYYRQLEQTERSTALQVVKGLHLLARQKGKE